MTNALRTWIAGLLLAFSAIVLTASSDPRALGGSSLLAAVVIFAHAWIVAVAERVGSNRGGVVIKRFPIGPRLLQTRPGLFKQFMVLVALLALVTQDRIITGVALLVVIVLCADMLRSFLPYLLPAGFVVWGLLSMQEFHNLGDLVVTARSWVQTLVMLAVWSVVLGGTLLRSDVGAPLNPKGRLVALLAGLPGYALAFWVFTRTGLAGTQPDLVGLCLVLLAGGVIQSVIVGLLAKAADLGERLPEEVPDVDAHDIGLALLPMALPIVACAALGFVPIGPEAAARATPAAWAGVLALMLIVPGVLGAVLVGDALDRVDDRRRGHRHCLMTLGLFGVWFLVGPQVLAALYAPDGVVAGLRARFPVAQLGTPAVAGLTDRVSLSGAVLGGDFTLWGFPATDLCRSATLMLAAAAALAARLLRHARTGLRSPGWGPIVLALSVQLLALWVIVPRVGPAGVGLATAVAAGAMLIVDRLAGVVVLPAQQLGDLPNMSEAHVVVSVVAEDLPPLEELPDTAAETRELAEAEPSLEELLGKTSRPPPPRPVAAPKDQDADSERESISL